MEDLECYDEAEESRYEGGLSNKARSKVKGHAPFVQE